MSTPKRHLRLNLFLSIAGHHQTAWRQPKAEPHRSFDITAYIEQAKRAEAAKLDSLFMADRVAGYFGRNGIMGILEPFAKFTAIAAATENIGVIMTASTTFYDPYTAARSFASLDHISKGRAAWNVVTSRSEEEARNFGLVEHPGHKARYERARELVDVAKKLWDSWDDDALVLDKETGVYTNPSKIRPINHQGEYFSVEGPLNVPRPIQGYPVLVQAGASSDGRDFAAHSAEAIFTAQPTFEDAQEFYGDVKSRMAAYGRQPEELVILPGLSFVLGETEEEAYEKEAVLLGFVQPEVGLGHLSKLLHVDLSEASLDDYLPFDKLPAIETIKLDQGRFKVVVDIARRDNLTIREIILRFAGGRGHNHFVGTPLQLADHMERWLDEGAADGFNLMPAVWPESFDDFENHVLPILRERGLFRHEYSGSTLRENYGLERPSNQYEKSKSEEFASVTEIQQEKVLV